jgi:hypothetical protein
MNASVRMSINDEIRQRGLRRAVQDAMDSGIASPETPGV